jgi:hypothetical protein
MLSFIWGDECGSTLGNHDTSMDYIMAAQGIELWSWQQTHKSAEGIINDQLYQHLLQ